MSLKTLINLFFIIVVALLVSFMEVRKEEKKMWSEFDLLLMDVVPLEQVLAVANPENEQEDLCDMITLETWMEIQDQTLMCTTQEPESTLIFKPRFK
jgi:hypothetical protein